MYALKIAEDNRIEMACNVIEGENYSNMIIVDTLPKGETAKEKDITNWLHVDGEYVYDPLPDPEPIEPEPTADEVLNALLGVE